MKKQPLINRIKNKQVGIWGYGRVGQSVANLTSHYTKAIHILDTQSPADCLFQFTHQTDLVSINTFIEANDIIIPSPGIDIRPYYALIKDKLVTELDLFISHYNKPIIGITGSVGKTTICSLLSQLYKHMGRSYPAIGNIGIPVCSALDHPSDGTIVEVSSFQLEHTKHFKPDVAVLTHFCPNHLDRHDSIDDYLQAKCNLFDYHQDNKQIRLIPYTLKDHPSIKALPTKNTYFFSDYLIEGETSPYYYLHNDLLYFSEQNKVTSLLSLDQLPTYSFSINWLIITAIFHAQGQQLPIFEHKNLSLPAHRMETVVSSHDYLIINDSKSTAPDATLAAVNQLQKHDIVLILGGLSKGIDRAPFVAQLKNKVKMIICFGNERSQLHTWCTQFGIPTHCTETIEDAVSHFFSVSYPVKTILLFSPAGASFDQFKNYEERGIIFKNIIATYFS